MQTASAGLVILFAVVQASTTLPELRLSRGLGVRPDAAALTAGAFILEPAPLCVALAAGTMFSAGVSVLLKRDSDLSARGLELIRRLPLWWLSGAAGGWLLARFPMTATTVWVVPLALALGLTYVLVDSFTAPVFDTRRSRRSGRAHASSVLRPLFPLLAGQVSLGAAMVVLSRGAGIWGVVVIVPILATIQYSFNLLLQTKSTYVQTIEALMRAAEAGSSVPEGHSRRVAELAVDAGRVLGLSSLRLERLNHAALVHEIGRLSADEAGTDYNRIAADVLARVPFLHDAVEVIEAQRASETACEGEPGTTSGSTVEGELLRASCLVDWELSHAPSHQSALDPAALASQALEHIAVEPDVRDAVVQAACDPGSRWLSFWTGAQ
ncbi:MAG: hypothetical protein QMC79_00005 [Anaerosomatales bacterium]|nr:hypothetical protein [Anaerosomatales bacterium]